MAAKAKFYYTVASKLADLPIVDGQIIFTNDTKKFYLDMKGTRLEYSDIQVLSSDSDRTAILAPIEGFYFIDETNILWRYKNAWIQITPSNITPFVFGEYDSFPEKGKEGVLYGTEDATYVWSNTTNTYLCISNKTEWKEV